MTRFRHNKMKNNIELEDGWNRIQGEAINKLISNLEGTGNCGFTKKEYSELYTLVYNMCTQRIPKNFSFQLYERFAETFKQHLEFYVRPTLQNKRSLDLLRAASKSWLNHQIMTKWMCKFFSYLDRHHVTQNNLPALATQAENIFYTEIFCQYQKRLTKACIFAFQEDREGTFNEREVIKAVSSIFTGLEKASGGGPRELINRLETGILEQSADHYRQVSAGWLAAMTFPEYLLQTEQAISEEKRRALECVNDTFAGRLEQTILNVVIQEKRDSLLEKETGIRYLIVNNKEEDLARSYRLYSRVDNGLAPIASGLTTYIKERGMTIVNEKEGKATKKESPEDPAFIDSLIAVLNYFKEMISRSFRNDIVFQRALKSAFEFLLNRQIGKHTIAEILACYTDRLLRKSGEKRREEEIEETLSVVIELFENLEDKDFFSDIYKTLLAKRLLSNTSASEDAEKSIITKMKLCCGAQYTSKMEGIVNDLHLATDIQATFAEKMPEVPIDFSVQVLTLSYWPFYKNFYCDNPDVMKNCVNIFNDYYENTTTHRKLKWMYCLGTVVLTGSFDNSRHDFICTTYQACLLCLFNDNERLSLEKVVEAMKCDMETCKKLLITMLTSKCKLLEKTGEPKKINPGDEFTLRTGFTSNMKKITLPVPQKEEHFAKEKVMEDRNLAIEAGIVRIMKSRKTLSHSNLITEVVNLLMMFRPQIKDIKTRIENLISREFLERDKDDPNVYHYVA